MEGLPLLNSIHSAGRCCTLYWRRKAIIKSHTTTNTLSYKNDQPSRCTHRCNSDRNVTGITNHHLIGLEAYSLRWSSRLTLLLRPRIWDWMGHLPRGKPVTIILLKEYNNETPNDIAMLIHQGSFFLQYMVINTEIYNRTIYRELKNLQCSSLNRMSLSFPSKIRRLCRGWS